MRINALLTMTVALGLAACQPTPVSPTPIITVDPAPVDTTPTPDPKPVIADDAPGSSTATATSLTVLTTDQTEQPGTPLPLVSVNAKWMAFQDGNGPWKMIEGTNGAYSFEVTNKAGKYGVAFVCPKPVVTAAIVPEPLPVLEMRLFTLEDFKAPRFACNVTSYGPPALPSPSKNSFKLSGTVSGISATETAGIKAFRGFNNGIGIPVATGGAYTQSLQEGTYNLLVGQFDKPAPGTPSFNAKYKKIILERDLNLNADTTQNFDFATQGFSPASKTLEIVGLKADDRASIMADTFLNGFPVGLGEGGFGGVAIAPGTTSVQLNVLPENQLRSGDGYGVQVYTNSTQSRDPISRNIQKIGNTWPSSLTLPDAPAPQVTAETETPYVRPKVTLDKPFAATDLLRLRLDEDVYNASNLKINQRSWNILASGRWFGNTQSLVMPDLSALSGWNPDLGFKKLSDMGWMALRFQSNGSLRYSLALSGDGATQREYTAEQTAQDVQNLNVLFASIIHPTADKTPPTVTNTIPSNLVFGSTENITLANTKNLEIQFSEEMDPASVLAAYESISLPANNVTFSWKARFGQPNTILVITPNTALTVGSTYSFTLGVGAKDISGNPLAAAKTFSFKVIP
jgi:Bacterial Ig-like domain